MKSKSILTLLCLTVFYYSVAQQKTIDSLEQQLVNPTNGKSRPENLIKLGHYYAYTNPEKGLEKLDEAVNILLEKGDSIVLASAYAERALNYGNLGKDSLAIVFYDKSASIYRVKNSKGNIAINLFNKSLIYINRSDYENAVKMGSEVLKLQTELKDTIQMTNALNLLGYSYMSLGNYTTSMKNFIEARNIMEKAKQEKSLQYANLLTNTAALNQRLKKYDTALQLHETALTIYKNEGNQFMLPNAYSNMGTVLYEQKRYNEALIQFKKAYAIVRKTNNLQQIALNQGTIGETYRKLKNDTLAIAYLDSAIVTNKKLKQDLYLAHNYNNKAVIYLYEKEEELSKSIEELATAKKLFNTALEYANKTSEKATIQAVKIGIARASYGLQDYKSAYDALEESRILKDSLLSDEKKEELVVLQVEYEFDKEKTVLESEFQKDQAIKQATIEYQIFIRNLSIGGGILFILLLSIGFFVVRKKREADYNAQISESKLQNLQAQMNPHFIFNTLNSINDYMLKNEKKTTGAYLTEFSNMIRKTLENTVKEDIALEDEIQFLENYIALEQKRLEQHFTFTITVDASINIATTYLPPSLLQPFVENSIWHGLSEKENGQLSIAFTKTQHNLICTIEDNGEGLSKEQNLNPSHTSFGLQNVKNRLDVLNKVKSAPITFDIKNKQDGGGVLATIVLPLIIKF